MCESCWVRFRVWCFLGEWLPWNQGNGVCSEAQEWEEPLVFWVEAGRFFLPRSGAKNHLGHTGKLTPQIYIYVYSYNDISVYLCIWNSYFSWILVLDIVGGIFPYFGWDFPHRWGMTIKWCCTSWRGWRLMSSKHGWTTWTVACGDDKTAI